MSMRTLLPLRGGGDGGSASKRGELAPYVKLPVPIQASGSHCLPLLTTAYHCLPLLTTAYLTGPVPIQATSLRRYLSPVEVQGATILSELLLQILQREPGIAECLYVLEEECAVHLDAPGISYESSRYVSALYRTNLAAILPDIPQPTQPIPLAALFASDPVTDHPILYNILASAGAATEPVEAARWFERHCQVVVAALVPIWLLYGVVLEMHGQNCLLLMGEDGGLRGLVFREVSITPLKPAGQPVAVHRLPSGSSLVSHGIAWHRMASHGIAWHRMASHGIAWHRMASH
jgi:hypothetical protein